MLTRRGVGRRQFDRLALLQVKSISSLRELIAETGERGKAAGFGHRGRTTETTARYLISMMDRARQMARSSVQSVDA